MSVIDVSRSLLLEVYDLVLGQWPDLIEAGEKTFHLGGGCNMRGLNELHFPIEEWALKSDFRRDMDTVIGSVEHYVFTTIHNALRNLTVLRKADLDFEAFASRFDSHPNFRVVKRAQD